jgi:hypothetical protein
VFAQVSAPGRNYPALFLALDEVLEAQGEGHPEEDALRRSFEGSADGFGAQKALLLIVEAGGSGRIVQLPAIARNGVHRQVPFVSIQNLLLTCIAGSD